MNTYATDPWNGTRTYWAGKDVDGVYRLRGYTVDLAWNIKAPNWSTAGLMQGGTGTGTAEMVDGLNWEASGENTSTWQNYYYTEVAHGNSTSFHNDVVFDIGTNSVPVVPVLNANAGLPNWDPNGGPTGHYITIVGYNDTTGEYAYLDTCGWSTDCNPWGSGNPSDPSSNWDGGVHVTSQSNVWNAVNNWGGYWTW